MTVSHPGPKDLSKFMRGDLPTGDSRRLVRQLLAAYESCRDELGVLWQAASRRALDAPSSVVERHVFELNERSLDLARQREEVPRLAARLAALPAAERKSAIRRDRAFHNWAFCEWLIDRCHDLGYDEVSGTEETTDLAVTVAEELDTGFYGEPLVNDLKARAWAAVANVLRITSDLHNAEDAFDKAERLVANGTGDALEEGWILELKAALRRDQQRIAEAHKLLDEVVSIYRLYRDFHLVGRAFVHKGRVHGAAGEMDPAIHWLRKGLALVDPAREPRLELVARHSLVLSLHESGRHDEAWFMLKASRPEFVQNGGVLLNLRLRWLEGKIQQALGRLDEAEVALHEARRGFVVQEVGFDAAMVCLDLASLYASQGRAAEMRRVAEEMLPIFRARDLHREAIAALIVFQQSVRFEKVNANLLQEIGAYLRRARKNHKLRFEKPPED